MPSSYAPVVFSHFVATTVRYDVSSGILHLESFGHFDGSPSLNARSIGMTMVSSSVNTDSESLDIMNDHGKSLEYWNTRRPRNLDQERRVVLGPVGSPHNEEK